jgi:predicted metal-binding membrane protein
MSETVGFTRPGLDQTIPAAAVVAVVAAAAWVALAAGAGHASHHEVLGSGHPPDPAAVAALLGGWLLMVAAMMLPPELAHANGSAGTTGRGTARGTGRGTAGRWWAEVGVMAATTCGVWTGFGIAALAGDAVLHQLADHRPQLAGLVAPGVLAVAGAFQLSPLRRRQLTGARSPSNPAWRHALCGLGSCWALMLVMFAIGVGDLRWMVGLTAVMTVERAASPRLALLTGPLVGFALIGAGVLTAIQPGLIG